MSSLKNKKNKKPSDSGGEQTNLWIVEAVERMVDMNIMKCGKGGGVVLGFEQELKGRQIRGDKQIEKTTFSFS